MVCAGLIAGLVFVVAADVPKFEASKECRGAFSSGFGGGFDVHALRHGHQEDRERRWDPHSASALIGRLWIARQASVLRAVSGFSRLCISCG
jgi:hypothetical protein